MVLILGCAFEEMLPKFAGVGFPILLVLVQLVSARKPTMILTLFAMAAGCAEEAISGLPMMTATSFLLGVALLAKWCELPRLATVFTYPLFQLWLYVWVPWMQGNVFNRVLLSIPIGVLTAITVQVAFAWLERKAAVDEQE